MSLAIVIALIVIVVLVALVFYLASIRKSLVRLKNDIDKAWANFDVLLKERHDELPKLIATCKGYMQHEQQTFDRIAKARSDYQRASTVPEKAQAENTISGALQSLFAVAKNYPELKANNNFMQLQQHITELEKRIADQREFFNERVNVYNSRLQQVPHVFLARMMHLERRDLFKAAEDHPTDLEAKFA